MNTIIFVIVTFISIVIMVAALSTVISNIWDVRHEGHSKEHHKRTKY